MLNTGQIQMVMRDMLFITWDVRPEILRGLVNERLELDTKSDAAGNAVAFVSAVCFRVPEVISSMLPLPRLSFEQVNLRAYVKADDVPAVYFLDMRVSSRMITAMTSFLKAPVAYEDIELDLSDSPARGGIDSFRYAIKSSGLRADAIIRNGHAREDLSAMKTASSTAEVPPDFITQRMVGYVDAGGHTYRIGVEHPLLEALPARIENVQAPRLAEMGLFEAGGEATRPHSALYVREATFGTSAPERAW